MKRQFFHKVSLVSLISLGLCKIFTLEMKMDLSFNFCIEGGRNRLTRLTDSPFLPGRCQHDCVG